MKNTHAAAAVLLLLGCALGARAADLLDEAKARGTLRIACEGSYPPFNFKDEKGELSDFDVEIGQAKSALDKALTERKTDGSYARRSIKRFKRDVSQPPAAR